LDIRRFFRWPRVNAAGGAGADGSWWPSYPNQNSDSVAQFAQYPPRAMRLPAVRRAVTAISSDLARMPIRAYVYNGDEWTDIGRDPIVIALTEQASEYHTSADFKRWMFTQCLTWGNSFALISRRGTSFDQFIPLNNSDVQMNRAADGRYYYTTSEYGDVAPADIIHLRMPSAVRQLWGDSPCVDAARTMAMSSLLETAGLEGYRAPGVGKLAISTSESVGASGVRAMADSFVASHTGPQGMLRPIIAQNGATVQQVGRSLVDQDWIAGRKNAIEDVARVFGIPPYVLFSESGSAYTAEQSRMYADSLAAYTDAWGAELGSKLYGADYCVKFDKTALLRGSFNESMQAYREAVQLGVMTPNEVRKELGLAPIDGGDDMYVGPNMQTTGGSDETEAGNAADADEVDDNDLG